MAQINKPSDYFNTKLYTGNSSTQSITGVGFQPDWVWCKSRSGADNHAIFDAVRGGQKQLRSNTTDAELTRTNAISSFDSDGWSMGSQPEMNSSGTTYASWNWLASNTTASNTDGSITSTVSANTTSGFSIITYTGTGSTGTIGHGLNSAPELVILRNREVTSSWWVWGELLGNVNILELQSDAGKVNPNGNYHNDTMPTSSVISIGSDGTVSGSGQSHICYAFHSVKSYSKIGSYTGNGNADGTFVYTGFKPAWILVKRTDASSSWRIWDSKRDIFNVADSLLFPDTTDAETTSSNYNIDIISSGFKLRNSNSDINASGGSYIYMAFAESPLVGTNNIPATAR